MVLKVLVHRNNIRCSCISSIIKDPYHDLKEEIRAVEGEGELGDVEREGKRGSRGGEERRRRKISCN